MPNKETGMKYRYIYFSTYIVGRKALASCRGRKWTDFARDQLKWRMSYEWRCGRLGFVTMTPASFVNIRHGRDFGDADSVHLASSKYSFLQHACSLCIGRYTFIAVLVVFSQEVVNILCYLWLASESIVGSCVYSCEAVDVPITVCWVFMKESFATCDVRDCTVSAFAVHWKTEFIDYVNVEIILGYMH